MRRIVFWSLAMAGGAGLTLAGLHFLRDRLVARPEYTVVPEVTSLEAGPDWLDETVVQALVREVEASLGGPFQVFEAGPILTAGERLKARGLARYFLAERLLPSQVRLTLDVPRPIAWYQAHREPPVSLDLEGRPIPLPIDPAGMGLPELTGLSTDPEPMAREAKNGAVVAWQVQTRFLPALEPGLALAAVDLSNHEYRLLADGSRGEVRVVLTGPRGNSVTLEWGRRPDNKYPPMPVEQKIAVARRILGRYPGFFGVLGADLRFEHRWESWITLASPEDVPR